VRIGKTRVDVGGRALDQDDPKTASAGRVLPIPDALLSELRAAKARQAAERLALGEVYAGLGYAVCNEAASPITPRRCPPCGRRPSRTSTSEATKKASSDGLFMVGLTGFEPVTT